MLGRWIITGTDTDAGKTLASAALLLKTNGYYWKPVQSGRDPDTQATDQERVKQLTNLSDDHFLPETYQLKHPLSPHRAAELEQIEINPKKILDNYQNHFSRQPLFIEGAGGLMVPVTREFLQVDLFLQMQSIAPAPIILVARTGLGTINHTLLSIAAIRVRKLPFAGILFSGPDNPDNIRTIADFSGTHVLGHIPQLTTITPESVQNMINMLDLSGFLSLLRLSHIR